MPIGELLSRIFTRPNRRVGRSSYYSDTRQRGTSLSYVEPPLKTDTIGVLSHPSRAEKINIFESYDYGMMRELRGVPQAGEFSTACFTVEKFWHYDQWGDPYGEIYIANHSMSVDRNGRLTIQIIGFCKNAEPDTDEYGVPVRMAWDHFMPDENPFERRERDKQMTEHSARLLKKHLHLILDDDL